MDHLESRVEHVHARRAEGLFSFEGVAAGFEGVVEAVTPEEVAQQISATKHPLWGRIVGQAPRVVYPARTDMVRQPPAYAVSACCAADTQDSAVLRKHVDARFATDGKPGPVPHRVRRRVSQRFGYLPRAGIGGYRRSGSVHEVVRKIEIPPDRPQPRRVSRIMPSVSSGGPFGKSAEEVRPCRRRDPERRRRARCLPSGLCDPTWLGGLGDSARSVQRTDFASQPRDLPESARLAPPALGVAAAVKRAIGPVIRPRRCRRR